MFKPQPFLCHATSWPNSFKFGTAKALSLKHEQYVNTVWLRNKRPKFYAKYVYAFAFAHMRVCVCAYAYLRMCVYSAYIRMLIIVCMD